MSTEDDLRVILHAEAATITPAGDGLTVIQHRLARRRRMRRFAVPSAGAVALGVAAAVFFAVGSGSDTVVLTPATHGPTPTPQVTDDPYTGPSLLSFTSPDKDEVVRRFLLQSEIDGTPMTHACESCDVVGIAVAGIHVGDAALARAYVGGKVLYSLVSIDAVGMTVTSPTAGEVVSSPTTVSGTLTQGVDESVLIRLLSDGGPPLGQTSAPAGAEVPWSASLSWQDRSESRASIVMTTSSPKDGAITRLAALPVSLGGRA